MLAQKIKGSFGCGGITGYFVDMLEEGYFRTLFDVQCFDLRAVESIGRNLQAPGDQRGPLRQPVQPRARW